MVDRVFRSESQRSLLDQRPGQVVLIIPWERVWVLPFLPSADVPTFRVCTNAVWTLSASSVLGFFFP